MKNNWLAGDIGTRSRMNQPFFLASGTVSSGNVVLQIGPGRMRFPHRNLTVFSNQAQAVTLSNAAAATYYSIFLRGDGTFLASGHATWPDNPNPPHPESEYLGTVFTGASLSTANLKGPWLIPSGQYEGRGEYYAMTAGRPRVVYSGAPTTLDANNLTDFESIKELNTTYTIADIAVWEPLGTRSLISATVNWLPSGALSQPPGDPAWNQSLYPSGVLQVGAVCYVERNPPLAGTDALEYRTIDSHFYLSPQNPDSIVKGLVFPHTLSFVCIGKTPGPGTSVTYRLKLGTHGTYSEGAHQIRLKQYEFVVIPGFRAKISTDQ